jgi:hypothetical protein
MRKYLLLIILTLSYSISIAQIKVIYPNGTNKDDNSSPIRNITDNGVEGIEVSYNFNKLFSFSTEHKGETYQRLKITGFSHLQEVGLPALPSHIDLVAVPEGAEYHLTIINDVPSISSTKRVFPALEPAVDTEGAPDPKFTINKDFYNSDAVYPLQNVSIIGEMKFRGIRMLMVQICPVQYNPSTEKLFLHENVNYKITFSGANTFVNYKNHTENYIDQLINYPLNAKSWKKEADSYYDNPANVTPVNNNSKNYIIITHSNYLAAADSIANWKRQMGYTVDVVSSNSWSALSVKNAVSTRYNSWTPKPDYLLIIGDHQDVPAEIHYTQDGTETFGSDLYYVCMDGSNDFVPDMAKGRISPSSATNAMMQAQRIINYERNPIVDSLFYQNALNCAMYQDDNNDGYADRRFLHTSENIRTYLLSQGYNDQRLYYTDNSVTPLNYNNGYYSNGQALDSALLKSSGFYWQSGHTDITSAINTGKFLVFHRDHGYSGGTGWAHPYYTSSKINNLSNGNKLPVVFSINCHTGEFTLPSCFAETFMRKNNGGAVGVIAASYYSYSGYNDGFSLGMIDGIWSNPGLLPAFGSGGNSSPNVSTHSDIVKMGDVMNHGLVRMVQTWGGGTGGNRYSYELFHYFGDPAMRIWTESPDLITANMSDTINCTDSVFQISNCNVSNAIATIMGNGVLLGRTQLVNGNGFISLNSIQGSSLTLTITARNKKPLIKTISIGSGNNMSLYSSSTNNVCYHDSLGSLEVFPACGTPPYQFMWNTGDTTAKIENLNAGTYTVIIIDAHNTTMYDTLDVIGPSNPIQINGTVENAKCYFGTSGSISLNVVGGAGPYSYFWTSGGSGSNRTGLSAGNYTVVVTDTLGCSQQASFVVSQPSALDMTTSFTDDTLNNCTGTATSSPIGGTPPYSFLWNDPANQTTQTAINLCKGLYKVTLKDSNECVSYRTIYINNTVGIDNSLSSLGISIYPNPSENGIFTLDISKSNINNYKYSIYNSLGQLIKQKNLNSSINLTETIDISMFASGVYYLHLTNDTGYINIYKLLKE